MPLPDIAADATAGFTDDYLVKTVARASVNGVETDTVQGRTVTCAVYPAQKAKLNPATVNWALNYFTVIPVAGSLAIGEFIEINGEDYKAIEQGDWGAYGFQECTVEQTKKAKYVVNA